MAASPVCCGALVRIGFHLQHRALLEIFEVLLPGLAAFVLTLFYSATTGQRKDIFSSIQVICANISSLLEAYTI